MLKNYIRIAWRNLRKHSFYSALNVFGLSLGVASGLILFLFISYHLSFDSYHQKGSRIYRVITDLHLDDGSVKNEKGAPLVLATALQTEVPQLKDQAFLFQNYRDHVFTVAIPQSGSTREKLFAEKGNIAFADQQWFHLFDYNWISGDSRTALEQPNTAVLTRQYAEKYFGTEDPVGKIIRIDGNQEVKITGVLKDRPENTDFKVDVFISKSSLRNIFPNLFPEIETGWGWISSASYLYLLLPNDFSPEAAAAAITRLRKEHMSTMAKYYDFRLIPLSETHFDARYGGVISKSLLRTLGIVGFIIMMIACVNFINMATAQNARRVKEISTRKILGSTKSGIFWQFMTETTAITLLAVALGLTWAALSLPYLNPLLQTKLNANPLQDNQLFSALLILIIFILVAAGIYPSILLSKFNPVDSLKSKSGNGGQSWLRKSLIVFQNLVAQSLIICTLIILMQTNYVKNADLGFNKDAVIMVNIPNSSKTNLEFLRNQLLKKSEVKDVSFCFRPPASETFKAGSIKFDNRDWENYTALGILGDAHYLNTFGLKLTAGRNLTESDTVSEFLVSEDMIHKLGLSKPDQVLGRKLVAGTLNDHAGTIVGVVKDIHLHSLHSEIEPLLITSQSEDYAYAGVKIGMANASKTIEQIKQDWQSVYPSHIFEYHFLDEQIAEFYKKEDLLNKLIGTFAVLAIIISCVGLLGLISLITIQRTREIGIRKVIGASASGITFLLSKDFAKLVGLSMFLSTVFAWTIMNNWLQGFAYRISIPWWVFVIAGICNLTLALLTICYHSIKAAFSNPTKSLRSE
jgi:putative ABC transport system permease protein